MATKRRTSRSSLSVPKKARRYGATVHALVSLEMAGMAVKALEHAPEIQVLDFGIPDEDISRTRITLRSLEFPRYWDGSTVDLYGDTNRGLVVLQHPAMEEEEEEKESVEG